MSCFCSYQRTYLLWICFSKTNSQQVILI